ncbi:hypothetical protein EJB05_26232 [Eragrostis curvula]|uniref:Uncharacterized protein n=1 Tax=Eragrostis curvula TaxID=38414 RepID=A0A5J9UJ91_9POAL|nr:hypothetical protein EJB05_26232 [Eragrostis curvula]
MSHGLVMATKKLMDISLPVAFYWHFESCVRSKMLQLRLCYRKRFSPNSYGEDAVGSRLLRWVAGVVHTMLSMRPHGIQQELHY